MTFAIRQLDAASASKQDTATAQDQPGPGVSASAPNRAQPLRRQDLSGFFGPDRWMVGKYEW